MADYIIISLHWWLAYLCCAAQYGYATWCEAPWLAVVIKKQVWKEDRKHLKRLVLWVIEFYRNNNNENTETIPE